MSRGLKGVAYKPPPGGLLIIHTIKNKTKKGQERVGIRLSEKKVGVFPDKSERYRKEKCGNQELKTVLRKLICASLLWLLSI